MNICILGSGKGSNCQAILESLQGLKEQNCVVSAVFSDNEDAGILKVADSHGIEARYISPGMSRCRIDISKESRWIEEIQSYRPDLIVLAGFMRILSPRFIQSFNENIINIHPSLLPSFKGLNAIQQAWDYGVKITGCTIHWVNNRIDSGEILAQAPVRVMQTDSLSLLEHKVQAAEHMLLPWIILDIAKGKIPLKND